SWRRPLFPETAVDYTSLFMVVDGAEEFFNWRLRQLADYAARPDHERTREAALALKREALDHFARTVGLEAPDDHTFRVTLRRPTPYFLDLCAFGPFHPVHPPTVE